MFTALWLAWLAAFIVIEGIALATRKPGDTLSEHVWRWFAIGPGVEVTAWVRVRRVVLLAFCVWLGVHFMTGGLV